MIEMGISWLSAIDSPAAGIRTMRISWLAYAVDEIASEANTASAVGIPSRWCCSSSLANGEPTSVRFQRLITSDPRSRPGRPA